MKPGWPNNNTAAFFFGKAGMSRSEGRGKSLRCDPMGAADEIICRQGKEKALR